MSRPMCPAEIRRWRFYAESLIEQAITILDEIDGDADLEDSADNEPSLGWTKDGLLGSNYSARDVDCEDDKSDQEPDVDFEPHRVPARLDEPEMTNSVCG